MPNQQAIAELIPFASPAKDAKQFHMLLNSLPAAVIAVDNNLQITFVNQNAEALLGMSQAVLLGKQLPIAALEELAKKTFASESVVTSYDLQLDLAGAAKVIDVRAAALVSEGADSTVLGAVLLLEDQGMMARIHQQSTQREIIRSTGVMAAMLAHEIKNPLSGIKGAAQLLEQDVSDGSRGLATLICNEVDRIKTLVNQIEFLSGPLVLQPEPVNIHEVMQYVMDLSKNGFAAHVRFIEQYDPSLPPVAGNRELLIQLFLNLVKNASEALNGQSDGTITLITRYDSTYRLLSDDSSQRLALPICVTVQDNGPGIPEHLRDSLLNPFVSGKTGGKGLGLTIVSKIVSDHGAAMELDTSNQTSFRIWLPVAG